MKELFIRRLTAASGRLLLDEPMYKHTSFKIGGTADVMLLPQSASQIVDAIGICRDIGMPYFVMGNGSNLLVRDGGIRGLVIKTESMNAVRFEGRKITAEAGLKLSTLSREAIQKNLAGLEFAGGIPGSVGGAVFMNAGAYGGEVKDTLISVTYIDDALCSHEIVPSLSDMGYRTSVFAQSGWIITQAQFALHLDMDGMARAHFDRYAELRKEKQPLNFPSAGSVFKRPAGHFAGKLIEDVDPKGFSIGGAQISEKHAGFIINKGGATACDVLELIRFVQDKVFARTGIWLETEIKIIGDDGERRSE